MLIELRCFTNVLYLDACLACCERFQFVIAFLSFQVLLENNKLRQFLLLRWQKQNTEANIYAV